MFFRFVVATACLALVCGGPVSSDDSSTSVAPPDVSVATSQVPDAEAPKLQEMVTADQGSKEPEVAGSPPNSVVEEKKPDSSSESESSPNADVQPNPKVASEVVDMMIDPYPHPNHTTPSPDKAVEEEINSDTVTVNDPHVNPINKTHEEEGENNTKVKEATTTEDRKESSTVGAPDPPAQEKVAENTDDKNTGPEKVASNDKTIDETPEEKSEPSVTALEQVSQHDSHNHPIIHKGATLNHTTQVAGILAGALVIIALLGYAGLLVWRRVLEKRYGNREMLVNEDDDFKHFEL